MFYEMNVIFAVRPAEKWTALIGKPCRTPLEMMESVVEEEEEERPDITYPIIFEADRAAGKRKRASSSSKKHQKTNP